MLARQISCQLLAAEMHAGVPQEDVLRCQDVQHKGSDITHNVHGLSTRMGVSFIM